MSYRQVKTPNVNVATEIGMCLAYVQNAFGSGWAGSYALQGWRDIVKRKHTNRNIPSGVYVPIWFSGYWNGFNYGHVAIYKDGVVYSSPYTNKRTHDRLGSIAEVERIYGMQYIGWSEDIGGTVVIEKGGNGLMIIENKENWYWRCNRTHQQIRGRELSRSTFKSFVGKDFLHFVETCSDDKEANVVQKWQNVGKVAVKDKWQQQIYDLQAKVKALNSRPTQAQLDAVKKQAAALQTSADKAQANAEKAQASAAQATEKLAANEAETAQAKKEADNFLTALINAVRGMFGSKS